MNKTPTPCSLGFENLPLSAQALFFHLACHASENGIISQNVASIVRERIGATDADVKALIRNKFVTTSSGGGQLKLETTATYPSLVVDNGNEEEIVYIFHRTVIWRQTVAAYEKETTEQFRRSVGLE